MQPESRAVVGASLYKFPEPEKLDPPDRLTIPIVCQIQDEAQHVPPEQHNLEAGDLAEAQRVHPIRDAGDQAVASQDLAQAQVPGHQTDPSHYIAQDLPQAQVPGSQAIKDLDQAQDPDHPSDAVPVQQHNDPVPAQQHSDPVPAKSHDSPVHTQPHSTPIHAQPQTRVHNPDNSGAQAIDSKVENHEVASHGDGEHVGGADTIDSAAMSTSSDEEPTTWNSIKRIGSMLKGLAFTVGTRVGLMMSLTIMFSLMMLMLRGTPTDLMQNTRTMGRSPTGGLDNILRFDNLHIAGVKIFKPGEDEDNPWVPVKPLHTPILNVEKEAPVDEYETAVAREKSGGGADVF